MHLLITWRSSSVKLVRPWGVLMSNHIAFVWIEFLCCFPDTLINPVYTNSHKTTKNYVTFLCELVGLGISLQYWCSFHGMTCLDRTVKMWLWRVPYLESPVYLVYTITRNKAWKLVNMHVLWFFFFSYVDWLKLIETLDLFKYTGPIETRIFLFLCYSNIYAHWSEIVEIIYWAILDWVNAFVIKDSWDYNLDIEFIANYHCVLRLLIFCFNSLTCRADKMPLGNNFMLRRHINSNVTAC